MTTRRLDAANLRPQDPQRDDVGDVSQPDVLPGLRTCADRQERPPVRAAALQLEALVVQRALEGAGTNRAEATACIHASGREACQTAIWARTVSISRLCAPRKPNETNRAQIRQAASAEPAHDPFKSSSANQGLESLSAAAYPRKS